MPMKIPYLVASKLYEATINAASVINTKARLRVKGLQSQKTLYADLAVKKKNKRIWFHCASLGEFEQARPLIEKIKSENPTFEIILTFFSPSGYEMRKNYTYADAVLYLPNDSAANAKSLVNVIQPDLVFWVKYEFWHYYLSEIRKMGIPLYLVSAIFRADQIFFKPYGNFFRKILKNFTQIYVQDENSVSLLQSIGIKNAQAVGDTRIDRVVQISEQPKNLPLIELFVGNSFTLVAGSTWQPDEEILIPYVNSASDLKLIIAPHEITESHLQRIESLAKRKTIRYSKASSETIQFADILIIDNIGMLSNLYRFGQIAYIGGGFGTGIHNTLEPAAFGIPVVFGPKYKKFAEANTLVSDGAFFSIFDSKSLITILNLLKMNDKKRTDSGYWALQYMKKNKGACEIIYRNVFNR